MIESRWERFKQTLCRWLGHREDRGPHAVSCSRCRYLLRTPMWCSEHMEPVCTRHND